jgi:hypothetical protein
MSPQHRQVVVPAVPTEHRAADQGAQDLTADLLEERSVRHVLVSDAVDPGCLLGNLHPGIREPRPQGLGALGLRLEHVDAQDPVGEYVEPGGFKVEHRDGADGVYRSGVISASARSMSSQTCARCSAIFCPPAQNEGAPPKPGSRSCCVNLRYRSAVPPKPRKRCRLSDLFAN